MENEKRLPSSKSAAPSNNDFNCCILSGITLTFSGIAFTLSCITLALKLIKKPERFQLVNCFAISDLFYETNGAEKS